MRKFYNNYKYDDYFLGLSPLFLLFFINDSNKFDIYSVIVGSFIYWFNKNMVTHIIDIIFACLFIFKYTKKLYFKDKFNAFLLINLIWYFHTNSYLLGLKGDRQLGYHFIFRILVLILFLLGRN
jgi:hypothetical protein